MMRVVSFDGWFPVVVVKLNVEEAWVPPGREACWRGCKP